MQWTDEQRQAIELRNKNILVAAAAGSGKTAVLVERIKRLILEEKCPVDRMLIVTFTNAAAAEMKEKIQNSIKETLAALMEKGEDREQIIFLKRQLNLLSTSNISTFHAFALEVIRRYFYLIQIEPNFKICDTVQETLLKGEAMDQLLDELFEEDSPEFYHFLKCYSGDRNENRFREIVDSCYKTIIALPEPFDWLEKSVEQLKDGKSLKEGIIGETLFSDTAETIAKAERILGTNLKLAERDNFTYLKELYKRDMAALGILKPALESKDYELLRSSIRDFKLPSLTGKYFGENEELKISVTENRNTVKKLVRDLTKSYFSGNFEELCHEMDLTYDSARYLQKLLIRYDQLYKEKKAEKNLTDFSDIEHYAYEILKDSEAASFYRERFEHIFIDEYQDSNVIQEALIDLIKRPNNLFMVGDVKQSIYKFRLAEPEIFQSKYRSYGEEEREDSVKIDLNKNFRSKKKVIDFINAVFEPNMDGYDDLAKLYLGDPYGRESYYEPQLYLADTFWTDVKDVDDELKNIMKAELEAMAAVSIIKKNLGKPIFDSKKGIKRPLEKKDIVILMRGVKNYGDIYQKVLTENDIPAYVDDNDGFFDTIEINTFLSALYIIDNPKQDIQLLTLLRSEMMGFSIEKLVKIRIQFKDGSYYSAFTRYAESGEDKELQAKCKEALDTIDSWRQLSKIMPLDQLIWRLLLDTGFYIAMGAMPAGSQRQANLRIFTDKAQSYEKGQNSSVYGFISYIEAIKEKKVTMGQVKMLGENDDLIRIMTIHKSKGLEFPMVILGGYSRRLNYSSVGKAPLIHKDYGVAFPLVNPENRWYRQTLMQKMIKEKVHREEVEEEKRILYVALTRAKDILVLLGLFTDREATLQNLKAKATSDNSYLNLTGSTLYSLGNRINFMDTYMGSDSARGKRRNIDRILSTMEECKTVEISDEIRNRMTYTYPYQKDLTVRTKYSVSQLNNQGHKTIESLKDPDFMTEEKQISAAGRGTLYHSVLEHMDIGKAYKEGLPYVENLLKSMVEKEILTEKEAAVLESNKLQAFITSDLAARIANSPAVYKEKRFNLLTKQDENQVIVRGIIDCFFEEDGQLVLLDYKTGNVRLAEAGNTDAIKERYAVQMSLYKEALEKATNKTVKESYLYLTDAGKIIKI